MFASNSKCLYRPDQKFPRRDRVEAGCEKRQVVLSFVDWRWDDYAGRALSVEARFNISTVSSDASSQ